MSTQLSRWVFIAGKGDRFLRPDLCGAGGIPIPHIGLDHKKHQAGRGKDHAYRVGDGGRELKPLRRLQDVSHGDRGHKGRRQSRHEAAHGWVAEPEEKHCAGPQHHHGQRLVGPGEITPQDIPRQRRSNHRAHHQQGGGQRGALFDAGLVDVEPVRDGEPCGAKSRVT